MFSLLSVFCLRVVWASSVASPMNLFLNSLFWLMIDARRRSSFSPPPSFHFGSYIFMSESYAVFASKTFFPSLFDMQIEQFGRPKRSFFFFRLSLSDKFFMHAPLVMTEHSSLIDTPHYGRDVS